jgi:AcrR family transcriptional regulator
MKGRDLATRDRLVATATKLFADRGFNQVTVRDICRAAHANVAAINYHFGSKLGLYREVLQTAISAIRETTEEAKQLGAGCPPSEKLRLLIHAHLQRLLAPGRTDAIHRLMYREMADPSPVLDTIVEQGIRPGLEYMTALVSELLNCAPDDARVLRTVSSIRSQWTGYLPSPILTRLGFKHRMTPDEIEQIAEHVTAFSLGGIRSVRNQ